MGTPLPVKHERTTRASDSFDLEHEQTLQASQFGTTSPPSTTTNSLGPKPESTLINPKCFERPATGTLRPLLGDYLSRFILVPGPPIIRSNVGSEGVPKRAPKGPTLEEKRTKRAQNIAQERAKIRTRRAIRVEVTSGAYQMGGQGQLTFAGVR